jgi:GT2 family glycosyltransferase
MCEGNGMKNILALFTCYNRLSKTKNVIEKLVKQNDKCRFHFVIVDDGSTDGTTEYLQNFSQDVVTLIKGNGGLYYSGGMRKGMEYIKQNINDVYDFLLLLNDDVDFSWNAIDKLIQQYDEEKCVIVGATCDDSGKLTYGAIKYFRAIKYKTIGPDSDGVDADTFNANCVLIPYELFLSVPIMDKHYRHALGDFDYGLEIKKAGVPIRVSREFVGVCNDNPRNNTWHDKRLPRTVRIKKKESIKGDPIAPWFYYLNKHFGLLIAIRSSITPYIRILLRL